MGPAHFQNQSSLSRRRDPSHELCSYNYDRFGNRTDAFSYTAEEYVRNFYQSALNRQPDNTTELQPALGSLQTAYAQGQSQFLAAMQNVGDTIFASAEYAAHNPSDNHQFVHDLYRAYLQREPDAGGWSFWEGQANANGRAAVRAAFDGCPEFAGKVNGTSPYTPGATVPADGLQGLTFDSNSNRINSAGYAYDAAGNQVRALISSGASQRFQYDAANRMVKVKADDNTTVLATYTYGDSNERLIADEVGYRTYYDFEGGIAIGEFTEADNSSTPAWSKSYVYLGNRLLSALTPNGTGGEAVEFDHPDRLGTRLVTNPSSGTSYEQVTLPFGTALSAQSTTRRFTSYDRSATTGLDYALNRHYDSQQGRFTQVDPAGMGSTDISTPQTLNLYAYCSNDPINNTDPSGLGFFSKLFKTIGKVFKIITIALLVATAIVMTTIWLAPASSLIFKAALWTLFHVLLPASHFLAHFGIATPGSLMSLGTPPWNPGGKLGNSFQGGQSSSCSDCAPSGIMLPPETVTIFANYSAAEMTAWRRLHQIGDFFMGAFDNGIGPPPILGFSLTHFGRRKLESVFGIKIGNEESWSYTFGSYAPDAVALPFAGGEVVGEDGLRIAGRVALDVKPHPFPMLGGRWSHLQLDLWRVGTKGSDFLHARIPLFTNLSKSWKWQRTFKF